MEQSQPFCLTLSRVVYVLGEVGIPGLREQLGGSRTQSTREGETREHGYRVTHYKEPQH